MELGRLLEDLPLEQRLKRYREFADEALRRAMHAHDVEARAGFVSMAAGWRCLAGEIERVMGRLEALDRPDIVEEAQTLAQAPGYSAGAGHKPADSH